MDCVCMCVYVCVHTHTCAHTHLRQGTSVRTERTTCENQFFPSTMWVPNIEFTSSNLASGIFICSIFLLALNLLENFYFSSFLLVVCTMHLVHPHHIPNPSPRRSTTLWYPLRTIYQLPSTPRLGWDFLPTSHLHTGICLAWVCMARLHTFTTVVDSHAQLLCCIWKTLFPCSPHPRWSMSLERKGCKAGVLFRAEEASLRRVGKCSDLWL